MSPNAVSDQAREHNHDESARQEHGDVARNGCGGIETGRHRIEEVTGKNGVNAGEHR
jgi:hypothetical protein